ncbi:MAG: hypothetical protein ACREJS_12785 [Candidatus Rokuibacteriota bacterium]
MAYSDIIFEVKNQIAWLTINRPDKGNTFRRQTVLEMANYYHTEEAKEMGRAFDTKQDPDPDRSYK